MYWMEKHYLLYYSPHFYKFVNTIVDNKFPSLAGDHPRLVIPFFNEKNELITKFELDNVKHVKVRNLSGGQVKKTTICMALIGEPQILLADEVFANLDVLSIQMLKEIFVKLQSENPKMCIIITEHQALELLRICDTAMILSNTKIIVPGTPSQLLDNQNARNAYFGDSFKFS